MPIMEISIVPIGTKTASISKYVADALKIIEKEKHIKYQLTSMGTIVESSSLDKLLRLAKKMHQIVLKKEGKRIVTTIKIDDRLDKKLTMEGKVESVTRKIGN
ncbi:unnamed protein product [marine sediment metagenome]|uniref:Thiamine-binding protein domain-containing protein n=1 Tax=marine sediment metagenome TaxID=412755 RepID=X0T7P8_9ZZZZ